VGLIWRPQSISMISHGATSREPITRGASSPAPCSCANTRVSGTWRCRDDRSRARHDREEVRRHGDLLTKPDEIHDAGVQHVAPIEEFPRVNWDMIIAINLSAAFHAMAAAIPGMKARKWGRNLSTASAQSLVASPFKSAYVAAKHGLAGLTKTAALELATFGVTVNRVSPGYVWTPLVEKQILETMAARNLTREQVIHDVISLAQPTKQFVTADQVAALFVFLCSDAVLTRISTEPSLVSASMAAQITGAN
jgi:NAD(P)-dependent dehydrogenase (short-subunit alcohol dehydrogenase family)